MRMKVVQLFVLVCAAGFLCGCVTPQGRVDPYESVNRRLFVMNRRMDRNILRPVAAAYVETVPGWMRSGLHNLLNTANLPVVFANDVLQARPAAAGETLGRLSVNVVLGLGVYDVARRMDLSGHDNDFGRTLGVWGWSGEPYLMLPLVGPSNPRDAVGFVGDIALDPAIYLQYKYYLWSLVGRKALGLIDLRASMLTTADDLERSSLDYYAATRSLARQYRQHQIEQAGGNPAAGMPESNVNLP